MLLDLKNVTNIEGSVTLPIQSNIQDTNQVDYQGNIKSRLWYLASIALDPLAFWSQIVNLLNSDASRYTRHAREARLQKMINALRSLSGLNCS